MYYFSESEFLMLMYSVGYSVNKIEFGRDRQYRYKRIVEARLHNHCSRANKKNITCADRVLGAKFT